jgi:hypothetical protein
MAEDFFVTINSDDKPDQVFDQATAPPLEPEVIIHTLPKTVVSKTASLDAGAQKARQVGLLILVAGVVFLVGAGFLFYFYFFKPSPAAEIKTPEPAAQTTETNSAVPADTSNNSSGFIDNSTAENAVATSASEEASATPAPTDQTATTVPLELKESSDSDQDGLTDTEEALLATDPASQDSDGDGYNDLNELLNLYNPAGSGKISANPNISKYDNSKNNYWLYYPKSWTINKSMGDDSILFQSAGNEFIQVIVQPNLTKVNLEDWYLDQFNVTTISDAQRAFKKGWSGITSEDGLNYYLIKPGSDKIFTVAYNPGLNSVLNYKNILNLIVNSLETSN